MDLNQNPFILLELSLQDNKTTIAEQFEEKVADGEIDEYDLMVAQKNLMASKTRLKAEIAWLPELSPKKAHKIANLVRCADYKKLHELLPTLSGLSCANVAAYLCSEKQGTKEILNHLFNAQSQIDTITILNCVNSNRSLAGFPAIDQTMVEDVITEISYIHAEAAMTYILSEKHPENKFNNLVDEYIDNQKSTSFMDNLAEKYDSWVTTRLRYYEDQIKCEVEAMKVQTYSYTFIENIIRLLKEWSVYSRPLQLIYQAKGLDEKRAKELYLDMRDVYLWLANVKNDHKLSFQFAMSLRIIFIRLPSSSAKIEDDLTTLIGLISNEKKSLITSCKSIFVKFIGIVIVNAIGYAIGYAILVVIKKIIMWFF